MCRLKFLLLLLGISLTSSFAATPTPTQLVEGLTSSFEHVRREAVENAPLTGSPAIAPISALLNSSSPVVVKSATLALERIVAYAGRPGAPDERAAVSGELVALLDAKNQESARRIALRMLGMVGNDTETGAIGALLGDPALAEEARATLERISSPGAVESLVQGLGRVPEPLRPALLATIARILERSALAGSGETKVSNVTWPANAIQKAVQAIKPYAGDPDHETRWCAFEALCRLGVPPDNLPVSPQQFAREDRYRYMTGYLDSAYANLTLGNARVAENMFATLAAFPMGDSQGCAALIGLAKLNSPKLIEHALGYMAEPGIRVTAIETLVSADIPEINERLASGLAYTNPSNRVSMLRILAARKAPSVNELLVSMKQDTAPEVRMAAFELLGEAPADTDIQETLAKSTPWNREHAAQLYVQRGESAVASGDSDRARVMFETVAAAKVYPETRVRAFQNLMKLALPASQPLVDRIYAELATSGTAPPSYDLAVSVAQAYAAVHAALPDKAIAEQDLRRLIESSNNPEVLKFALQILRELGVDSRGYARRQGFVTDWLLLGPFPNPENSAFGKPVIDTATSMPSPSATVDVDGSTYTWQPIVCDAIPAVVDLKAAFHGGEHVAAYACAMLTSDHELPVTLLLGSNDGCEVWVNQSKVLEHPEGRGLTVDEDRIETVLKPGHNTILIRILQLGGAWGVCLRVVDQQGAPLDTSTLQPAP